MTARHTDYTIRGVPAALDVALRRRAQERGASLNQTVIDALAAALGVAAKHKYAIPQGEIDAAVETLFDLSAEHAPELGPPLTAELLELGKKQGEKRPDFDRFKRRALIRGHDHPDDRVHAILGARRLGELVENIGRAHTHRAGEYKTLISENTF